MENNSVKSDLNLIQAAAKLKTQREELEAELKDLEKRKDLAIRRLAAFESEKAGGSDVWLGTPSEIVAMKDRLKAACTDEGALMRLVSELREKREMMTNEAINHYAQRDKQK